MSQEAITVRAGLEVVALPHPQGCRTYLVGDPDSREALVVDAHLDEVGRVEREVLGRGWRLRWIVDTHTHADHPSGAAALAQDGAVRVAHTAAGHRGVTHHPDDGEPFALGDRAVVARLAPGHTPDHLVLVADGVLFSGDSLLIGAVARTDFLGGDAGVLYDSLHRTMLPLDDDTVLLPGHDYAGRIHSTLGEEKHSNPWLALHDRDAFVKALVANPPPEPANMAALLRFNREGQPIPPAISAEEAVALVREGGAGTIIDVRTQDEVEAAHVPGSRHILLDTIPARLDDVLVTPAPRLLLCHVGERAEMARRWLVRQGVGGLRTVVGGIDAYARAGGEIVGGKLDAVGGGGGCAAGGPPAGCAATPPES